MSWPVNARTSAMMDEAQALYGATITATQGSPNPGGVGASAGTHDGEGVIDVSGADLDAIVIAMRQVGFAAWHRTPAQGFSPHVHGVAIGEPGLSPQAAQQVDSYFAGTNGLRGNGADDGPRDWVGITWETYSGGTYVPPTGGGGGGGGGDPVSISGQFPGDRSGTYTVEPDGILTGSPTFDYSGAPVAFNRFRVVDIDTEPPPITLHMAAGDSVMSGLLQDFEHDYYEDLSRGYWLVRVASGTGTIAVSNWFDVDFEYPGGTPTWTPLTLEGTSGGFMYYRLDPTWLDVAHLRDGNAVIRITCTSGTVDITFVGMQIQQAQGYYQRTGDTVWSATFAASYREPERTGFNTYQTYIDGLRQRWTVDDTLVLGPVISGFGDSWDDWRGSGQSFADAETALNGANVDFHPYTSLNVCETVVSLEHVPLSGILGPPTPEHWDASVREAMSWNSAPTKQSLDDVYPSELLSLTSWEFSAWEFTDGDSSLLGWHQYSETSDPGFGYYIQTEGDADTVTYSWVTSSTDVDLQAAWPPTGVVIQSDATDDVPPYADPYLIPIPDTFLTTTDNLLFQKLELARRGDPAILNKYTTEYGYAAGNEGTSSSLTVIRLADGIHIGGHPVTARFRTPPWRYSIPTFTSVPGPPPDIDFDEDLMVTWLRQRQRNDGLGNSITRARGVSSQQNSLRQRGYR